MNMELAAPGFARRLLRVKWASFTPVAFVFSPPDLSPKAATAICPWLTTLRGPALALAHGIGTAALAFVLSSSLYAQTTLPAGQDQPFNHSQPGLVMHHVMATMGAFPYPDNSTPDSIATVHLHAGQSVPYGEPSLQGQVYPQAGNAILFFLLGTSFGGDDTTFAFPNLSGRFTVGIGAPNWGGSPLLIGQSFGSELTQLTPDTLPAHSHSLGNGSVQTSSAGGSEPINLHSPSLPMTYMIAIEGTFPNTLSLPMIGMIRSFAGDFAPGGWLPADGRLLSIDENEALYEVIGTLYGGDNVTTFALPDLRGRLAVGHGQGAGLNLVIGESPGLPEMPLGNSHLPLHTHGLSEGGSTNPAGGSEAFSNLQPSLGIKYLIATTGIVPGFITGSYSSEVPTLGEVIAFAGTNIPTGSLECAGQILTISTNQNLFNLLGTAYGGDGVSNFALPDLRGRAPIGVGNGFTVGQTIGVASTTLIIANMSSHTHDITDVIFENGFEN